VDGEIDTEYHEYLAKHSNGKIELYKKSIENFTNTFPKELITRVRHVDDCYHLFNLTVNKDEKTDIMDVILSHLPKDGSCIVSLQNKKLHIFPSYINKILALEYISQKYNLSIFISAGDSTADLPMLKGASVGLIPATGELVELHSKKHLSSEGFRVIQGETPIHTGEEVLKTAKSLIEDKN